MIIVFGGTFNPPTLAHEKIVEVINLKYKPSRFIILPVGDRYTWKKEVTPFSHRYNMLKEVFEKSNIEISTLENSDDYKGTYNALLSIKGNSNQDLHFVLGADNLIDLDKWINYKKLLNEFKFIVLTRDSLNIKEIINNKYSSYKDNFEIIKVRYKSKSSDYRNNPLENKKYINKDVLLYIEKNKLYRR